MSGARGSRTNALALALVLSLIVGPTELATFANLTTARLSRGEPSPFLVAFRAVDSYFCPPVYALDHETTKKKAATVSVESLRPPEAFSNSSDSQRPASGAGSREENPKHQSAFGNNPVNRVDPFGMDDKVSGGPGQGYLFPPQGSSASSLEWENAEYERRVREAELEKAIRHLLQDLYYAEHGHTEDGTLYKDWMCDLVEAAPALFVIPLGEALVGVGEQATANLTARLARAAGAETRTLSATEIEAIQKTVAAAQKAAAARKQVPSTLEKAAVSAETTAGMKLSGKLTDVTPGKAADIGVVRVGPSGAKAGIGKRGGDIKGHLDIAKKSGTQIEKSGEDAIFGVDLKEGKVVHAYPSSSAGNFAGKITKEQAEKALKEVGLEVGEKCVWSFD